MVRFSGGSTEKHGFFFSGGKPVYVRFQDDISILGGSYLGFTNETNINNF